MTGSNGVNLVSENMSSESKTLGSELASWHPDTRSQTRTSMTSVGEKLTQMGTFIETEGAKALLYSSIIVLLLNILFTYVVCFLMVNKQDGMQKIGWSAQQVEMNGKKRQIYMPVFIKTQDYRELENVK